MGLPGTGSETAAGYAQGASCLAVAEHAESSQAGPTQGDPENGLCTGDPLEPHTHEWMLTLLLGTPGYCTFVQKVSTSPRHTWH